MAVSRGHHFIPQGYLRNFTDPKNKDQLVVFDRTGKRFTVGTAKIAKQRDFNTVRGATPPDVVETYYSGIEDGVAVALKEVCQTGHITDRRLESIIALITMLHVRSPRKRMLSGDFMSQIARGIMQLTVRDQQTYEATLARMRAEGHDVSADVGYEEMRRFVDSGNYDITTENEAHINIELSVLPEIETVLRQRNWCLMIAPRGSQFVSSDHPSNLFTTTEWDGPRHLGLGHRNTEVFLPISADYALAGRFEEQPSTAHVDYITVAERNAGTIYNCSRQVYAQSCDFMYKRPGELLLEMKTGSDLASDQRFIQPTDSPP